MTKSADKYSSMSSDVEIFDLLKLLNGYDNRQERPVGYGEIKSRLVANLESNSGANGVFEKLIQIDELLLNSDDFETIAGIVDSLPTILSEPGWEEVIEKLLAGQKVPVPRQSALSVDALDGPDGGENKGLSTGAIDVDVVAGGGGWNRGVADP
jgi:hypothetical protein